MGAGSVTDGPKKTESMRDLWTTREAADLLGVSPGEVSRRALAHGLTPAMVVGTSYLWSREQIRIMRPRRPYEIRREGEQAEAEGGGERGA